ncbi:hypothetical protein V3C99_017880 [Haemonchus contortus]
MWCKWGLEELRTTNLAEAFHRRLPVLINVDHPPLSVLIEALRKLNYEARAALTRLQEDRTTPRSSEEEIRKEEKRWQKKQGCSKRYTRMDQVDRK